MNRIFSWAGTPGWAGLFYPRVSGFPALFFTNRFRDAYRQTTLPRDITYAAAGGNVIVAMGQLGVAVGLHGGEWREVAVGDNYPRDFSFAGKLNPLTETGFWGGALAAFAVGGVAVALYALSGEGAGRAALIGIGYVMAMPISAAIVWFINLAGLIYAVRMWILAIIAIGGARFIIDRRRKGQSTLRTLVAAFRALREKASGGRIAVLAIALIAIWLFGLYSVLGAVLGAASLLPYSVLDPGGGADESFTWVLGAVAVVFSAVGLALAALAVRRLAAASAIALSYALLVAAFALWIANAIPAAVLFLLAPIAVAGALWRFLRLDSQRRRGGIAADS